MAGFLFQTTEQEQIGFLLLPGKRTIEEGDNSRDCVFMGAPSKIELVEHELNRFLSEFKSIEFHCAFSQNNDAWEATISIDDSTWVQLHFTRKDGGT